MMSVKRLSLLSSVLLIVFSLTAGSVAITDAQAPGVAHLSGKFNIGYAGYDSFPLLVGLNDASGLLGSDPNYIAPKDKQMLGKYTGSARGGQYTLDLPPEPEGRPFDVTGSGKPTNDLLIFDVRLMSDVASRGYMVPNEDMIADSLNLSVDVVLQGGKLLVWTADNKQQFPTDYGADKKLFTADDPRTALPTGWSLVDLDSHPFKISEDPSATVDLTTTGSGGVVNYQKLSCAELIPAFLDRVQSTYPFTDLKKIDWATLRAKLIPASQTAQTPADCQRIIRDFANAIPDGHVDYRLPALRDEYAGSTGLRMAATSDGQIVATVLRSGGPAAQAGMKLGALITQWDGKPINDAAKAVELQFANSGTPDALLEIQLDELPRGPMGSKVSVTFQNPGEKAPITATLTRDEPKPVSGIVTNPPQVEDDKLPSGLGYIRIDAFESLSSLQDFDKSVDNLIAAKVPGIIIDVRSNPGGLSQMSDAMASRFYDQGFVVGKEYALDGRLVYQDLVDPRQPIYKGCVAVLVNSNTASSGDIFAYTFKASQRAIIVGNTPSAGMAGTVSGGFYNLPDGAFIQVPTGGFYDDNKQLVVEGQGVAPDVKVPITVESLLSPEDGVLDAAVKAVTQCSQQPSTATP
ncbi:MAG: S41 family peptidase [Chloroflexota bacterium]